MTLRFIIVVGLLFSSVCGDSYYKKPKQLCPLKGDGDDSCGWIEDPREDSDPKCWDGPKPFDAEDDCHLRTDCLPELCRSDCSCGGKDCDQRCYMGCQQGAGQGLIKPRCLTEADGPVGENYANTWKWGRYFGEAFDDDDCDGGQCGTCAQSWCAAVDVREKNVTTYDGYTGNGQDGMCRREVQTWRTWEDCGEWCPTTKLLSTELLGERTNVCNDRVCVNNLVNECEIPTTTDYHLLGMEQCSHPCGFNLKCDIGEKIEKEYVPMNAITDFKNMCKGDTNDLAQSNFKVYPKSCEDLLATYDGEHCKPKSTYEYEYKNSGAYAPTHRLYWNVVRLNPMMCDPALGMQENRYLWGACAEKIIGNSSEMCFAAVDRAGLDTGNCNMDEMGATAIPCYPDDDTHSNDNNNGGNAHQDSITTIHGNSGTQAPGQQGASESDTAGAPNLIAAAVLGISFAHTML